MHSTLEIITPAECFDLTVLETVKTELGISPSDTSSDEHLAILIRQASSAVSAYCDQIFAEEEVEETFWAEPYGAWGAEWMRSLPLSRAPVTAISSVVIDDSTLDAGEYRLASDGFLHRIDSSGVCQWAWTSTAVVTYTAGYALLDDLPHGIERATLLMVADYWSRVGRDPRVRSENIPGVRDVSYWVGSIGETSNLPPDVIALLKPYRRLAFA